jgi:hypothetical protein
MKKILIIAIMSTLALVSANAEATDVEMCKIFINEAKTYQATMKEDKVSKATLAFYKDSVVAHCGNIVAKIPYEKDFFANTLMKKDTGTVNNCKLSIKMAQSYAQTTDKSFIITNAHKINVIDNCGTLVARKTPAFCFYDVAANSK